MSKQTKYVAPHTVLSPKASVSDLHVIFDGGIYDDDSPAWGWTGWSLATMLWDGDPAVGVRWNGEGDWVGTPSSRGLPTWFILPDPLAKIALDRVDKHLKGGDGEDENLSPRARLFDLITFVRSASDEELNAMIGQMGIKPASPAA
jgi:hypothetical protein